MFKAKREKISILGNRNLREGYDYVYICTMLTVIFFYEVENCKSSRLLILSTYLSLCYAY